MIKILISQERDHELILFGEDSEVAAGNDFEWVEVDGKNAG